VHLLMPVASKTRKSEAEPPKGDVDTGKKPPACCQHQTRRGSGIIRCIPVRRPVSARSLANSDRCLPCKSSKGGYPFRSIAVGLKSSTPIRSIESPSHYRAIHRLILVGCPLQVVKGGIVSPIHVSSLVLQPRRHHRFIKFPQVISRVIPSVNPHCRYRSLAVKSSKGG
jgi:hypothetical protein